jgi:endonuclease YncB( thermonuclease family)
VLAGSARGAGAQTCALEPQASRAVVRVIDGETLALDDGTEVRLVGALAPRAPAGNAQEWPFERAAVSALELLVKGRTVQLKTVGRQHDRYGRLLAHVFVADGGETVWVQRALVTAGHVRAYALPGNEGCLADLLIAEETARESRRGLWASVAYQVHEASDTRELLRIAGSFAVVEGRVERVAKAGRRLYLNFGTDWRRDFSISVPPTLLRGGSLGEAKIVERLKALAARRVRVRGWIQRRNGPLVEISSIDEIEVIGDAEKPALDSAESKAKEKHPAGAQPGALDL